VSGDETVRVIASVVSRVLKVIKVHTESTQSPHRVHTVTFGSPDAGLKAPGSVVQSRFRDCRVLHVPSSGMTALKNLNHKTCLNWEQGSGKYLESGVWWVCERWDWEPRGSAPGWVADGGVKMREGCACK
jgi:hypothetical protein